jgi:hypothetical protein
MRNRVLRSYNQDGETRCVDIFVRPDGSYGFEEYRRDPEDGRGWFAIGASSTRVFANAEAARAAALNSVPWLASAVQNS